MGLMRPQKKKKFKKWKLKVRTENTVGMKVLQPEWQKLKTGPIMKLHLIYTLKKICFIQ